MGSSSLQSESVGFGRRPICVAVWDFSQKHHGPTNKLMKLAPGGAGGLP